MLPPSAHVAAAPPPSPPRSVSEYTPFSFPLPLSTSLSILFLFFGARSPFPCVCLSFCPSLSPPTPCIHPSPHPCFVSFFLSLHSIPFPVHLPGFSVPLTTPPCYPPHRHLCPSPPRVFPSLSSCHLAPTHPPSRPCLSLPACPEPLTWTITGWPRPG